MSTTLNSNQNPRGVLTYQWLVGILISIFILIAASWVNNVQATVTRVPILEANVAQLEKQINLLDDKVTSLTTHFGTYPTK